ncbi:MAG: XdhC family protein [Clostridia bacterium]|nr:XdhC family protein [Clostridia bacterium]
MRDFYRKLSDSLKEGKRSVYCTIIATMGSSPAGPGSCMAVFEDGSLMGTVGGGAVEFNAIETAKQLFARPECRIREFQLNSNLPGDIGMVCGGTAMLYFRPLLPDDKALCRAFERAAELEESGGKAWFICKLETGEFDIYAKTAEEAGLEISGEALPEKVLQRLGNSAVLVPGDISYYTDPVNPEGTVFLFGGGHVGKALCKVLDMVDFPVTVLDDRPEIAVKEDFASAKDVILCDYEKIAESVEIGPQDYIVVMTHGHEADTTVLRQVLKTDARYIGCMGSKNKTRAVFKILEEEGFSAEECGRINAPIGVSIGSKTPAEVAVSVAAELIAVRSGKLK